MKKSIIIIDDSSFIVDLLSTFFSEQLDFQVLATGNNGMAAVSLYKEHKPDLMTMDLTMPVKDGKTALQEILKEFPDARILMISSQLGPSIVECLKIGASGYIEKPLQLSSEEFVQEFQETVSRALALSKGNSPGPS